MINSKRVLLMVLIVGLTLAAIYCKKSTDASDVNSVNDVSDVSDVKDSKVKRTTDSELGISTIRSESLFDETLTTPGVNYIGKAPGAGNKKFGRAFENAPPMIPHSVNGLLPIKKGGNTCLNCHMPSEQDLKVAKLPTATLISTTHISELDARSLKGKLNKAFFNCSQCHAPQADLAEAKSNKFAPLFRSEMSKSKSTLKIKTVPFAKSSRKNVR